MRRSEKNVDAPVVDLTTDFNSKALLRRQRRRRQQTENEIPVITLGSSSPSTSRSECRSIEQASARANGKEIKVLLVEKTKTEQKLLTLDVLSSCSNVDLEMEILTTVFSANPTQKIVKDDLGYKLILGDYSDQRIILTHIQDPKTINIINLFNKITNFLR